MAIKEFENLETLKFDEFTGSLIGHEEKIKDLEVNENIPKKLLLWSPHGYTNRIMKVVVMIMRPLHWLLGD